MARIGKVEHPRILAMVDQDGRKVTEVAAAYGCTPANIYALLGKLRRVASLAPSALGGVAPAVTLNATLIEEPAPVEAGQRAAAPSLPDLFALSWDVSKPAVGIDGLGKGRRPATATARAEAATFVPNMPLADVLVAKLPEATKPMPLPVALPAMGKSEVVAIFRPGSARKAGAVGAAAAKPGVALVMRTADGEENVSPFRSLDDLLSAIKPILRAVARSPDAVWFSIQPVDLASLDSDAA